MSNETAWLVEHPHDPRFGRESWYAGAIGFTIDSLEAIRYARREDALRVIDGMPTSLGKNLRAEQHAWISAPPHCSRCDEAKIEADQWRGKYKHLHDSWRLVGETLRELDYNPQSEDQWVSKVYAALVDFDRLKRRVRNYVGTLEEIVDGLKDDLPNEKKERTFDERSA